MQATRPLPAPVRAFNAVGRGLRKLGIAGANLSEESLLAAARKRTGLRDFGSEEFRIGLGELTRSLEADARLSSLGRIIARTDVLTHLENRLRLVDWRNRHPAIAAVVIERPIFIVGMPRTGTTILHELIAQDPRVRVPLTWEVDRP